MSTKLFLRLKLAALQHTDLQYKLFPVRATLPVIILTFILVKEARNRYTAA